MYMYTCLDIFIYYIVLCIDMCFSSCTSLNRLDGLAPQAREGGRHLCSPSFSITSWCPARAPAKSILGT